MFKEKKKAKMRTHKELESYVFKGQDGCRWEKCNWNVIMVDVFEGKDQI